MYKVTFTLASATKILAMLNKFAINLPTLLTFGYLDCKYLQRYVIHLQIIVFGNFVLIYLCFPIYT